MAGNKIKFAIAGYGYIGKRHAEMVESHPEAELSCLIDTNEEVLASKKRDGVVCFDSVDVFLKSTHEADVLIIATPNGLHAQHALAALKAGKHVIIEKPMALNKSEAEDIINLAAKYGKLVLVVVQNRYAERCIWLKQMVDTGKLGRVFMVVVNCFWNRDERYYKKGNWHGTNDMDGGTLFTQFSHFVDIVYWIFGDIHNIKRISDNSNHSYLPEFTDTELALFNFRNGGIGSFNFTTSVWNKNLESSITVIAENGSIKLGGQYMNEVLCCHVKDYDLPSSLLHYSDNNTTPEQNNHYYVVSEMIDLLKKRKSVSNSAADGLKIVEIIEKIYGS
jgi:UDP-N-acetyl-2-amino-2-deoxyglucuronate dehydrogenase